MKLDDLRERWQERETGGEGEAVDRELVERVRSRAEHLDRRIRRRDWLETVAGLVGSVPFVVVLLTHSSWLARIGAALVIVSGGYIVWRLHSTRRGHSEPPGERTLAASLRTERDRLDAQIELLQGVFWWYLAPLDAGLVLTVIGTADDAIGAGALLAALGVLNVLVVWLNRRAVRRHLEPRRRSAEDLLRQLDGQEPNRRPFREGDPPRDAESTE